MAAQPSGTVTFLFSDIEGSTRLVQILGEERYAVQLDRHREILRSCFAAHDGYEVEAQGDAFFVAFASAAGAVESADDAQQALAREPWPDGCEIRVRIGIHTGEPLLAGPDYVGMDVHKAARIMAAGHGGQVLVSEATRALLDDRFTLRELGERQLKDLQHAERLYQLVVGDEDVSFPPLRTLEGRRTNLPTPVSDFIGRDREVAGVVALVRDERRRLVTLTGVGGVGKTRLAWRVASELVDEFPAGVVQASLSALNDEQLVLGEIAGALAVDPTPSEPVGDVLAGAIGADELLLLLDSFDRVRGAATAVARLLESCPQLVVLATSRVPLGIEAETVYPVPPLSAGDARDLLVARAQAQGVVLDCADPALTAVVDRVDRLPLALELAAARLKLLSPAELATKIEEAVFESGRLAYAPTRQQTIRSMIDWSYDLMTEPEQCLFADLSVFSAGAPLTALEGICEADLETLSALLDAGFVRRLECDDGVPRFVLPSLVQAYARDRLHLSGREPGVARAHATYYLSLARQAAAGRPPVPASEREQSNYRSALAWAEENDPALAAELADALGELFHDRGQIHEQRSVMVAIDRLGASTDGADAGAEVDPAAQKLEQGRSLLAAGDAEQALRQLDEAYRLARAADDAQQTLKASVHLAYAELACGRQPAALRSLLVALRLSEDGGRAEWLPACFEGFAAIAAVTGEPVHAARMQGAAAARGAGDADLTGKLHAETEEALVATLGPEAYRAARDAGAALAPEEAAAQARSGRPPE